MGESFMGFPNRLRVVNNLLEQTYDPNHALSSYMGYKLFEKFNEYLPTSGGTIDGTLQSSHIHPYTPSVFDIGSQTHNYNNVYAVTIHGDLDGNSKSASKLYDSRKIEITGAVTGACIFDGSQDTKIDTKVNHNHNNDYLGLTGGTLTGNLILSNNAAIIGTNNNYILALTSENVLQLNYGTYTKHVGNTTIYSSGDLDIRTHSSGITVTSSLFKKTVNLGTSSDSVFIANTESNNYLHLSDDGKIRFNEHEIYHHGNFQSKNMLTTEYKEHMDKVVQIVKAIAITLDKLEVDIGNKDSLSYPGYEIEGDLLYYKDHAMDILDNNSITQKKGD